MRREEVFESSTAISSTMPGNAADIAMTRTFWCCLCNRQKTGHANFYGDDGDEAAFFDRVGKMSVQKLVSFLNARGCLDETLGKVPEGELASHRTAALKQYLGRLDTAATVAYQPPGHPACLCCDGCLRRKKALKGAAVGLVAGAGAALLAGPALAAVGFTTAGVAAGSWAAGFQSAVYGAYTAAVPFGVLQSVGAAGGLSASAVAGTAAATAVGGAALNSTRSSATKDETTTRDDRLVYRSKEGAVQGGDEEFIMATGAIVAM
eukprot:CAMPEP_0197446810 /NCGR_PEP_ID=MMETSP1175-20131217/11663_1 /TAXON_ID=1003142 /ORGANISM="Triceratium dubium, Strain CCMP147" /LENGTH=263 /DNA_ID=CAMNT_0042977973 /DNA_START=142 /DNA_END=934 /DNA_ORIENTATION=-